MSDNTPVFHLLVEDKYRLEKWELAQQSRNQKRKKRLKKK